MTEETLGKIRRGDGLTDKELDEAADWFGDLVCKLALMGPEYYLAWSDAHYTLRKLLDFQKARKND